LAIGISFTLKLLIDPLVFKSIVLIQKAQKNTTSLSEKWGLIQRIPSN